MVGKAACFLLYFSVLLAEQAELCQKTESAVDIVVLQAGFLRVTARKPRVRTGLGTLACTVELFARSCVCSHGPDDGGRIVAVIAPARGAERLAARTTRSPWVGFLLRRLLSLIVILLALALATFSMVRLIPGDPALSIAGIGATPQQIATIR